MKSELVIEKFADMMIQRMEQMKDAQWQRGWIKTTFGDSPINLRGTAYNGTNAFLLYLLCDLEGWDTEENYNYMNNYSFICNVCGNFFDRR